MFKKYGLPMLLSSLALLLPIPVGLMLWDRLPPSAPIHMTADGTANGLGSKGLVVFLLPLILLAVHLLCLFITLCDKKQKEQSPKVFTLVLWIMPLLSISTTAIIYALSMGWDIDIAHMVLIMTGLMFILIGNYLPKCKQNRTIGIKIKWTFESEANWNATHRMAGKLWVAGGLLMLFCILLPPDIAFWTMPVLLTILVMVPFAYSYLYHRRHKDGPVCKVQTTKTEKRAAVIGSILGILILIGSIILCFTGDIDLQAGPTALTIKASYWQDLTVEYDRIDQIELHEEGIPGIRVYGFGTPRLLMGSFRNESFGNYTRYTYTKAKACIVLTVDDQILVIGCKDNDSTRELYEHLSKRWEDDR